MTIQAGDRIPEGKLKVMGKDGPMNVEARELLGQGRVVMFSVPGAFTPTCDAKHLPGFIEKAAALKAKGVGRLVCLAVNDVFVMNAWGKSAGVGDAIVMAADGNGEYTGALGLELDARGFGMGMRGKHVLMDTLVGHGVEYIFGNPGTTESPLMDGLAGHPRLRYIVALHEGVALGAAAYYAHASGRTAFVNLHVAPGLGNALGMLYDARFHDAVAELTGRAAQARRAGSVAEWSPPRITGKVLASNTRASSSWTRARDCSM